MKFSGKFIVIACIVLVLIASLNAEEVKKKKKSKKAKKKNVQADAPPAERPQKQQPDYPTYPENYDDYGNEYEDSDNNLVEGRDCNSQILFNLKINSIFSVSKKLRKSYHATH